MRVALLVPLVAGLGCAGAGLSIPTWHDTLTGAIHESTVTGKPLLVLSLVGDLRKRC